MSKNAKKKPDVRQDMLKILEEQRAVHLSEGPPDAKTRIDWIDRAIALLCENKDALVESIRADFGHRPIELSMLFDVLGTVESLRYVRKRVHRWMRPERRSAGQFGFLGRARMD